MPPSTSGRTTDLNGKPLALAGPELAVGDRAPDFQVVDSSMQNVTLASTGNEVRIFSVVPSLDTPVCDAQTKRFEEAAAKLPQIKFYTLSMDLPFAQKRWCSNYGVDRINMISDHRNASFGQGYGTLISDLRIESRAIFVVDRANKLCHVEYVKEVSEHPDYDSALKAATEAAAR